MLKKVAIITDADKGIGVDLIKLLRKRFDGAFYFTSRDVEKGTEIVAALNKQGLHLEYHHLDISNKDSIENFRDHIHRSYGGIDMLINNVAISNGVQICDSYEKVQKVIKDYYYNFITVQELFFPLLRSQAKVIYVAKPAELSCIRNQYWFERLSMKYLKENDINDFLEWYLDGVRNGTFEWEDFAEDRGVVPYRIANVALTMLVSLQRKNLQSRCINMDLMYPSWAFKK